jgi:hypothetical protein
MIIDQLNIFFDNTTGAASANGATIPLMPYMGRNEPVNVTFLARGPNVKPATLVVTLQESDDNSLFSDVVSFTVSKKDALPAVLVFALPYPLTKRYVRLKYTLALTSSGGGETATVAGFTIWAGVTRDHFAPYAQGQYIDRGKVVA